MPAIAVLPEADARRIRAAARYPTFTSVLAAATEAARRCRAAVSDGRLCHLEGTTMTTTTVHCSLREHHFRVDCLVRLSPAAIAQPTWQTICASLTQNFFSKEEPLFSDLASLCGRLGLRVTAAGTNTLLRRTWVSGIGEADTAIGCDPVKWVGERCNSSERCGRVSGESGTVRVVLHARDVFEMIPVRRKTFEKRGGQYLVREELRRVLSFGYRLALVEVAAPPLARFDQGDCAETRRNFSCGFALHMNYCPFYEFPNRHGVLACGNVPATWSHAGAFPPASVDCGHSLFTVQTDGTAGDVGRTAACVVRGFYPSALPASRDGGESPDLLLRPLAGPRTAEESHLTFAVLVTSRAGDAAGAANDYDEWEEERTTRSRSRHSAPAKPLVVSWYGCNREGGQLFAAVDSSCCHVYSSAVSVSTFDDDTMKFTDHFPLLIVCHPRYLDPRGAPPPHDNRQPPAPSFASAFGRAMRTLATLSATAAMEAAKSREVIGVASASTTTAVSLPFKGRKLIAAPSRPPLTLPPPATTAAVARLPRPNSPSLRFQYVLGQVHRSDPLLGTTRWGTSSLRTAAARPRRTPVLILRQAAPTQLSGDAAADLASARRRLACDGGRCGLTSADPLSLLPVLMGGKRASCLQGWRPPPSPPPQPQQQQQGRGKRARAEEDGAAAAFAKDSWPPLLLKEGGAGEARTLSSDVVVMPWAKKFLVFFRRSRASDDDRAGAATGAAGFAHALARYAQRTRVRRGGAAERSGQGERSFFSAPELPFASLWLADQHAAHERLRLEFLCAVAEAFVFHPELEAGFTAAHGVNAAQRRSGGQCSRAALCPARLLQYLQAAHTLLGRGGEKGSLLHRPQYVTGGGVPVPADLSAAVRASQAALARWGWRFDSSTAACYVTQWPLLCVEGFELELTSMEELRCMATELSSPPPSGSTSSAIIPSAVFSFLVTRSCRGAVMFGDSLSIAQSRRLLADLSGVEQFYICSHGRPAFTRLSPLQA